MLALLGRALASVGHELNNVAGVVQSYAGFIQEGKDARAASDAEVIRAGGERATRIAKQLLAFGHPRDQDPEALELGPFLVDVQAFLQRALGDTRQLSLELCAEPASVHVRRAVLGRALLELVLAAHVAVSPDSRLRLVLESSPPNIDLSLREERLDGGAATSFGAFDLDVDWPDLVNRLGTEGGTLVQTFDRTRGLALSLSFVGLDALPRAPASERPTEPDPPRVRETLLVVESNAEQRHAICRVLEATGYRVLEAEDAETARSLGLGGDVGLDLLLVTRADPTSAGALLTELRQRHPSLTSLLRTDARATAELLAAVRTALDERQRVSDRIEPDDARVLALVVDDEPHVRLGLSRILNDVGADVLTAPSGLHALQKLQSLPIDLLIADQLMPGMEGTRLLETAYKTWPHVVRVVYSGYLSSGLVVDAVNRANVHKLLSKDMSPEALRQQLVDVVAEIRARRAS